MHFWTRNNAGGTLAAPKVPALRAGHSCHKQVVNAPYVSCKRSALSSEGRSQPVCDKNGGKSSALGLNNKVRSACVGVHPRPQVHPPGCFMNYPGWTTLPKASIRKHDAYWIRSVVRIDLKGCPIRPGPGTGWADCIPWRSGGKLTPPAFADGITAMRSGS
jgi:hypothetical protein